MIRVLLASLCLLLPTAMATDDPDDAVRARLESLSPDQPRAYLELGEEVQADATTPEARALARRLFVLSVTTGLDTGDSATAAGACLALAQMATTSTERRWLRSLAGGIDSRFRVDLSAPLEGGTEQGLELSIAITRFRAGEGRIARRAIERPELRELLEVYAPDAWIRSLEEEARDWPCRECGNDRFVSVPGQAGVFKICPTCRGNPGPRLDRHDLLESLRIESVLMGVGTGSWSAQLALGRDEPMRDAEPRDIAQRYGVDPALCCWREGAWVACPEADSP
ncbi:MAG: hypothetical protein ACIARR_05780 [Phycisphaerales bacterium JB059]